MIDLMAGIGGCVAWGYLIFARGGFWRCAITDRAAFSHSPEPECWPAVAAIVPARNEAENVARSLRSLIGQDYPGRLSIIVVDDQSADGTGKIAEQIAGAERRAERSVTVISGRPVPAAWTGKLFAMRQGLAAVEEEGEGLILFADADIEFAPQALRRLVSIARARGAVLTSLMVKLRCESFAERWLVPAFVFFFQMLYPFAWVGDQRRATAAAAGGCMLIDRAALNAAGGLEAMRGALIDDCALAALMKRQGPIWLGLTDDAFSFRAYPTLTDFGQMVSRSAFAELRFSAPRLAVAVAGMAFVFLLPPLLLLFGHAWARAAGAAAWATMAVAFAPTLKPYRLPVVRGFMLPLLAAAYIVFTCQSALQFWRGRGGLWKGRVQAPPLVKKA